MGRTFGCAPSSDASLATSSVKRSTTPGARPQRWRPCLNSCVRSTTTVLTKARHSRGFHRTSSPPASGSCRTEACATSFCPKQAEPPRNQFATARLTRYGPLTIGMRATADSPLFAICRRHGAKCCCILWCPSPAPSAAHPSRCPRAPQRNVAPAPRPPDRDHADVVL
jgi:hypothetical protein